MYLKMCQGVKKYTTTLTKKNTFETYLHTIYLCFIKLGTDNLLRYYLGNISVFLDFDRWKSKLLNGASTATYRTADRMLLSRKSSGKQSHL